MNQKKKRNAILKTFGVLFFGFILSLLFELMPDGFKQTLTRFATGSLGLSYSIFWIICTTIVIIVILFFTWRQALSEKRGTDEESKNHIVEGKVNVIGKKNVYIKKNKGDIHIK
ncbi:MAG: hypothetical protein GY936_18970 [Ignavibacteriae bacterium]|nr:hypothetical protein [Ignavibacteriota bacterium]